MTCSSAPLSVFISRLGFLFIVRLCISRLSVPLFSNVRTPPAHSGQSRHGASAASGCRQTIPPTPDARPNPRALYAAVFLSAAIEIPGFPARPFLPGLTIVSTTFSESHPIVMIGHMSQCIDEYQRGARSPIIQLETVSPPSTRSMENVGTKRQFDGTTLSVGSFHSANTPGGRS